MQLLQKIQTLTDAAEEKKHEFEDQGKFNLFCLLENLLQFSEGYY